MIRLGPGGVAVLGIAALAALGLGAMRFADHHFTRGYDARAREGEAALAVAQARIDALAAEAAARAARLAAAEAENQTLLEDLTDEANRDPAGLCLSVDSVRRLNAIAGHATPDAAR